MIVPADDTNDYTPVLPPDIQVGQEVVLQYELSGEITYLNSPFPGVYAFQVDDGSFGFWVDDAPPTSPWQTTYLYKRQPKPARGALFTAADGSRWVHPRLPHGLYRCWQAGTTYGEGLASRASIEGLVED